MFLFFLFLDFLDFFHFLQGTLWNKINVYFDNVLYFFSAMGPPFEKISEKFRKNLMGDSDLIAYLFSRDLKIL